MQDLSRDDFSLLDGVPSASPGEKETQVCSPMSDVCDIVKTSFITKAIDTTTSTTTIATNNLSRTIIKTRNPSFVNQPENNRNKNNSSNKNSNNTNSNGDVTSDNTNNKGNGFTVSKSIPASEKGLYNEQQQQRHQQQQQLQPQQQQQSTINHHRNHDSYFDVSPSSHQLSSPLFEPIQKPLRHRQQPQQQRHQQPLYEEHHHPLHTQDLLNHHHQQHSQYRLINNPTPNLNDNKLLLLQNSDDPLICRGANIVSDDDPPAEFKTLMAAAIDTKLGQHRHTAIASFPSNSNQRQSAAAVYKPPTSPTHTTNGCNPLVKQQLKIKACLMSKSQQRHHNPTSHQLLPNPTKFNRSSSKTTKKSATLKLRFHHQALPAEYLSHYEATQIQVKGKAETPRTKTPPAKTANENVRSWLQNIAEIHRSSYPSRRVSDPAISGTNNNSRDEGNDPVMPPQRNLVCTPLSELPKGSKSSTNSSATLPKRVTKYSDLPFMGEITLDNTKPRRGRKPKKADICHLIYKNYGTILPGTPKSKLTAALNISHREEKAEKTAPTGLKCPKLSPHQSGMLQELGETIEEPLNLCLRDHRSIICCDYLSISSLDEDEVDDYTQDEMRVCLGGGSPNSIAPLTNVTDQSTDSILSSNLKTAMPRSLLEEQRSPKVSPELEASSIAWSVDASENSPASSNTLHSMHPIGLYYQKLIAATKAWSSDLGLSIETIERDNQLALKIPIPRGLFLTAKQDKSHSPATPSSGSNQQSLEYPESISPTPSSIKSENSMRIKVSSPLNPTTSQSAPKRKRSSIYIPPIPAEVTTHNPSNEVSICKFKFTGGARPMLQEKKMLSVDAGGNYRYYSGTGDKSSRGFEYFPRESVQQNGGTLPGVNSVAGVGGGEKMVLDIPPPSADLSNELLQIPDSPTTNMLLFVPHVMTTTPGVYGTSGGVGDGRVSEKDLVVPPHRYPILARKHQQQLQPQQFPQQILASERKKKTRRSSEREKLEKTFKEKGFLIQTQQLESAEGATYCKFRQLKKFTRYLFRNWKDYLPDELQQANEAAAAVAAATVLNRRHLPHQSPATTSQLTEANLEEPNSHPVCTNQHVDPSAIETIRTNQVLLKATEETHILHERLVEDPRVVAIEPKLN